MTSVTATTVILVAVIESTLNVIVDVLFKEKRFMMLVDNDCGERSSEVQAF